MIKFIMLFLTLFLLLVGSFLVVASPSDAHNYSNYPPSRVPIQHLFNITTYEFVHQHTGDRITVPTPSCPAGYNPWFYAYPFQILDCATCRSFWSTFGVVTNPPNYDIKIVGNIGETPIGVFAITACAVKNF